MDNPALASDSNIQSAKDFNLGNLPNPGPGLPRVTVDQLLLAGAHFGHLTRRWNPKMKKYIFMSRNGIYLIDLLKTQSLIDKACKAITQITASGEEVLFVGTKKQAREIVEEEAKRGNCPYVTHRWLGGMLTNFSTIRRSLKTLETFDRMATDGTFSKITKKEQLSIGKSQSKLNRTLGGIREMKRLPGAVFIVDTNHESIAVAEARKLDIPIFAIVDTNVNPDLIDYPIPANDDAFKSIWLISRTIADAVLEGKSRLQDERTTPEKETAPEPTKQKPRRSRRRRKPRRRNDSEGTKGNNQERKHEPD